MKSNRRAYLEEAIILILAALVLAAVIFSEARAVTVAGIPCDGGAVLQFNPARLDCDLIYREGFDA